MKSTEFITEKEITPYQYDTLNVDRAVAALNAHCSQSIAMIHYPLWRGMKNHSEQIIAIDPSTGERASQNTSNHYTQLIDNSPYYAGWPKRSKSLVCSSSLTYASAFSVSKGGSYAIFPYDGVKIAVCPTKDFWAIPVKLPALGIEFNTPNSNYNDMSDFNYTLHLHFGLPNDYAGMLSFVQTPKFAEVLAKRQADFDVPKKDRISADQFIPYIQQALSPAITGIELMTVKQYAESRPDNRECWVGGPVIAIRQDMYKKFLSAVVKQEKV